MSVAVEALTRAGSVNVFTLTKAAAPSAPVITTTTLPDGVGGTAYSQVLSITGSATITTSVLSGSLPAWASLNTGTHTISGTPNAAGVSSFTIRATNSAGTDDQAFTLTVPNRITGGIEIAPASGSGVSVLVPALSMMLDFHAPTVRVVNGDAWTPIEQVLSTWIPL
jgi:hypothetical protein